MYAVPFRAVHLFEMDFQAAQRNAKMRLDMEQLRSLEGPHSHTLMLDGAPLACCGALEMWEGRAYIWAFLSDKVNPGVFLAVFKWAKLFIANLPFRRLEASAVAGFDNGERLLHCLGFKCYDPRAEAFTVDGLDASLWVKVKPWKP